jgi:hypothetical protein
MRISRELALQILKYLVDNPSFYFPFFVMYKEYTPEDDDFVEIDPLTDYETIRDFEEYQTFELWENLQDLKKNTTELMAKGFIEHITGNAIEAEIAKLAEWYREEWDIKLCDSEDTEEYGRNEFIGGKAEAFEESLEIIRKYLQTT